MPWMKPSTNMPKQNRTTSRSNRLIESGVPDVHARSLCTRSPRTGLSRAGRPAHRVAAPNSARGKRDSGPGSGRRLVRDRRAVTAATAASISASVRVRSAAWNTSRQARLFSSRRERRAAVDVEEARRRRAAGPAAARIAAATAAAGAASATTTARSRSAAGWRGGGDGLDVDELAAGQAGDRRARRRSAGRRAGPTLVGDGRMELADDARRGRARRRAGPATRAGAAGMEERLVGQRRRTSAGRSRDAGDELDDALGVVEVGGPRRAVPGDGSRRRRSSASAEPPPLAGRRRRRGRSPCRSRRSRRRRGRGGGCVETISTRLPTRRWRRTE